MIIDESHQTVPQVRGMYHGDRSRKEVLVAYGFRLPSALDNRPLNFEEWEARVRQLVFVSATPGPYELPQAGGAVVEQIIRPTGLVDPPIDIRPVRGQVDDLLAEIRDRVSRRERVLVTTLTKRMAEDLTQYYQELGVKVRYLHSDIDTLERIEILRDLRRGEFDVLVGINLLREGLDLPEVSLVAILDADKEGFLRSGGSLIQTVGRAARNVNGRAIMYADRMTDSMRCAIGETDRRRTIQEAYNEEHGITPASIVKSIDEVMSSVYERDYVTVPAARGAGTSSGRTASSRLTLRDCRTQMKAAAANLEFEKAAALRDRIKQLRSRELGLAGGRRDDSGVRSAGFKTALLEVQEYVADDREGRPRGLVTPPFYFRDIIEQFESIGVGSLTVVLLTGMFTGMVLALQSGFTLDQFGARSMVGRLVSASMVKELGPGADRADGRGTRRLGHRRGARIDDGHRSDRRAARARHRSDPQAGAAAHPRRRADGAAADRDLRRRRHGRRLDRDRHASSRSPSVGLLERVVQGLYIQDVWMGLIKPFFLGFAIVTIGCHVGLRTTRRHAGRRPGDDQRGGGQLGGGDCGRLPGHQDAHRADVLMAYTRNRRRALLDEATGPRRTDRRVRQGLPGVRREGDPARGQLHAADRAHEDLPRRERRRQVDHPAAHARTAEAGQRRDLRQRRARRQHDAKTS